MWECVPLTIFYHPYFLRISKVYTKGIIFCFKGNHYKRPLESTKLDYASYLLLPRNLFLTTSGEFVVAFSPKVKSVISSLFNGLEVL